MSDIPPPPRQDPSGYSNYPRANFSTGQSQRPPGVYFDAIGIAWRMVQAEMSTWVLTSLVFGILVYAIILPINLGTNILFYGSILGPTIPSATTYAVGILTGLIPGMLIGVIQAGMLNMAVKQARGEPIRVGDMFKGFSHIGHIMLAALITTILTYIGIVLLIIPGMFAIGLFTFVPILIVDQKMTAFEAIETCWKNLKPHALAIFALVFVAALLSGLGVCLLCVGILFTIPIFILTIGLTYTYFFPAAVSTGYNQQIGIEPPR